MSAMISAWMVTSRPVVGSSRMSSPRQQRHRDHHPLGHAAGELVRVLARAAPGRDVHCRSAMTAASALLAGEPWCSRHTSAICAQREDRIQGCPASWKPSDRAPRMRAKLFVQFGQVLAVEQDPPGRAQQAGRLDL